MLLTSHTSLRNVAWGRERTMPVDEIVQSHAQLVTELEELGFASRMADAKWSVSGLPETLRAKQTNEPRRRAGRDHRGVVYAHINDGRSFVLVPASRELRALKGKWVTISRDARGRIQARAAEPDRGGS
jgi:hypothetical protein